MPTYVADYERVLVKYKADEVVEPDPTLSRIRTTGASGEGYFTDGKNFYKQPRHDEKYNFTAQLHTEPAAAKAMQLMGAGDMVHPSEHVVIKGVSYLKSPLLHTPIKLYSHQIDDDLPHSAIPTHEQLSRYALASWVIHSMDRHDGNYVTHEDSSIETPIIKALDLGETFHPNVGFGGRIHSSGELGGQERGMHPMADALYSHLAPPEGLPLDKSQLRLILSNKKALLSIVKEGTKGMTARQKKEAQSLINEKFTHLQSIAEETNPMVHNLPHYEGFTYVE